MENCWGASPAVANGVVYIRNGNSLYALDAGTGAQLWSHKAGGWNEEWIPSSPAVANGVVFIGSVNGYLYALNANTGAQLWSYKTVERTGRGVGSPAVANGMVYVAADDPGRSCFYAFGLKKSR
jgi:outer membrane protein assembly factor BamB